MHKNKFVALTYWGAYIASQVPWLDLGDRRVGRAVK